MPTGRRGRPGRESVSLLSLCAGQLLQAASASGTAVPMPGRGWLVAGAWWMSREWEKVVRRPGKLTHGAPLGSGFWFPWWIARWDWTQEATRAYGS